ncbi:5381_t:CDS:2 [Entrophospora sp. SA101]|nr:5381_t:CDS:2 [Entrophospora sp. SA101]
MPLQHYIYPCVSDGIFMIADEKGNFHQENFKKVIVMLDVGANTNAEYIDYKGKKKSSLPQTIKGLSDVYKIVNMIMLKKYDPVIFFTFSRKECENLALHINHLDLNTDEEKDLIQQVFDNALNLIPEDDQNIPQFKIRSQKLRKLMGSGKVWENCGFFYFPCLTGFQMKHIKFLEEINAFKATIKISAVELLRV